MVSTVFLDVFQLVEAGQPYTVIVDYAHTPDGLENVLKTARSITEGKLWVVFGCGGDRDNKKGLLWEDRFGAGR